MQNTNDERSKPYLVGTVEIKAAQVMWASEIHAPGYEIGGPSVMKAGHADA